jgi:hypothetical protein
MAGAGAGLGAGLLGGVLGGTLLGGRGILGGEGREVVTPAQLQTGLAGVIESQQNTAVLQTLGAIQGSIPLAEGQVQLALSGVQSDITSQVQNQTLALNNSLNTNAAAQALALAGINSNIAQTTATVLASNGLVKDAIAVYGTANLTATKDSQYATATAIASSTKEILAAINGNEIANLQRQLAVSESRGMEDRAISRSRDVEVNVTQTVNQNQLQAQLQSQSQQQTILLSQLAAGLGNLTQIAHATNANIIAGNTGAVTTGAQTSAPTNIRA